MAKKKKVVTTEEVDGDEDEGGAGDALPLFSDVEEEHEGARIEVWRVHPDKGYVGELDVDSTPEDVREFVRASDVKHRGSGGLYRVVLKSGKGRFMKSRRMHIDGDGSAPAASAAAGEDFLAHKGGILGTVVGIMEAGNRSYFERARQDARDRESEHKRQVESERSYWEAQRIRDREAAQQQLQMMQMFFSEMGKASRAGSGGESSLETLMMGAQLKQIFSDDDEGIGAKLKAKFAEKLLTKLSTIGDEPATPAPQKKPDDSEDAGDESEAAGGSFDDAIAFLLEHGDVEALTAVLRSLLRQGKVKRALLRQIASGDADDMLREQYGAHLDKLKSAVRKVLAGEPAPKPERADGAAKASAEPKKTATA